MKKKLLVVGGERYWHEYLPEFEVAYCRLQSTEWLLDTKLRAYAGGERLDFDGVFWRVGAITPEPWHRHVLELIRLSGVPSVNAADALLRGWEKLSVLGELRAIGAPTLPVTVALGSSAILASTPELPAVVKLGNLHGGLGKARAGTEEEWTELRDLATASRDYAVIEPFLDYARDVRCIAIKGRFWAMERRNHDWKVNRGIAAPLLIEPPLRVRELTDAIARRLGADVIGVDFLEDRSGHWFVLECNDPPGLTGFPEEVRTATAAAVRAALA